MTSRFITPCEMMNESSPRYISAVGKHPVVIYNVYSITAQFIIVSMILVNIDPEGTPPDL
jgi:hypothetical protein